MTFLSGRQAWTLAHLDPIDIIARGLLRYAGTYLGPMPTIMCLVALVMIIIGYRSRRREEREEDRIPAADAGVVALSAVMLLVSALAELMTLPYQLGRVLLPGALLSVWGVVRSAGTIHRWLPSLRYETCLTLLMVVTIVGGPLPRVVHEVLDAVEARRLSRGLSHPLHLSDGSQRTELDIIVSWIERNRTSDDHIAIVSGYTGYLSLLLSSEPAGGVLHGHQLIARFAPASWRQRFLTMIEEKQPLFLVVDRNDSASAAFVGGMSSIEWLRRTVGALELDRLYREGIRTESYVVYERVGDVADTL
jgi:hypothetical protein